MSVHSDMVALFSRDAQVCPGHPGLYVSLQDIVFVNTRNLLFSVFDDGGFDMDESIEISLSPCALTFRHQSI